MWRSPMSISWLVSYFLLFKILIKSCSENCLTLLSNTSDQIKSLLHCPELAVRGTDHCRNSGNSCIKTCKSECFESLFPWKMFELQHFHQRHCNVCLVFYIKRRKSKYTSVAKRRNHCWWQRWKMGMSLWCNGLSDGQRNVHFRTSTLRKCMNPLILQAMGQIVPLLAF